MSKQTNLHKHTPSSKVPTRIAPAKPASFLQTLQRKTSWLINFQLHPVSINTLYELNCSLETLLLAKQRNEITKQLQESIRHDYENNKAAYKNRPNIPF